MALTPAQLHFKRVSAKQESADQADPAVTADTTQYELQLLQLAQHKRQLKQIQSVEQKIDLKRKLLPEYGPYIEGVLESDSGVQDDVLMTVMVWAIDTGDIALAARMAEYAMIHNMATPDQYDRDLATVLTEETAEYAIKHPGELSFEVLDRVDHLVRDADMPDQVRAKLHKAFGLNLQESDPAAAITNFERALELNDKCGVKKLKERLQRDLKNAAAQAAKDTETKEPQPAATE
ncbi:MAG: phage terminase small subunit [Candidatus Sedimenticola sp. (ex Thyasira tokunagai)]